MPFNQGRDDEQQERPFMERMMDKVNEFRKSPEAKAYEAKERERMDRERKENEEYRRMWGIDKPRK